MADTVNVMSSKKELLTVFAENLKEARDREGLSQEALAKKAGFHRTYVGLLEKERSSPSLESVQSLAEALGMTEAELMER